jgi:threonine/homoserine/homoserine lactone efflux protein
MSSFIQGVLAGYGIAIPVGAVAILIIDIALRRGFRDGFMAGAGAASADLIYAIIAALAGTLISGWIAPFALPLRIASGFVLVGLGGYGLYRLNKPRTEEATEVEPSSSKWRTFTQFLGITLLNPMTIAYFGSLILGGTGAGMTTAVERALFVAGAGLASFSWQTLLAVFGALAHKRLPPRLQLMLSVFGNLIVIGFGVFRLAEMALTVTLV